MSRMTSAGPNSQLLGASCYHGTTHVLHCRVLVCVGNRTTTVGRVGVTTRGALASGLQHYQLTHAQYLVDLNDTQLYLATLDGFALPIFDLGSGFVLSRPILFKACTLSVLCF